MSAYVYFISWRLFFYAYSDNYRDQMDRIRYNLKPFKTIVNYMHQRESISLDVFVYNLAGNVAAFMPLGFLLPLAFRNLGSLKTFAVSFTLILAAEIMQLISRRGVFDVDDLILNMIGSMLGYMLYRLLFMIFKGRR